MEDATLIPFKSDEDFGLFLDQNDSLSAYRKQFHIPRFATSDALYFCGNSLGLQPKNAEIALLSELSDWKHLAVEGHFHAKNPWYSYHELFTKHLSLLTNALPQEVVVMNSLTVNLNLLMVSFYRPTNQRFKILIEHQAFPSDIYAVSQQIRFHGYNPTESIIEIKPRHDEYLIRDEDILEIIEREGDEIALVLLGGVNYYSGQVFDMKTITQKAHAKGCICGFDLAHAIGNIELNLHDWNMDFAVWCSYKYLNGGPGAPGGAFIHERHITNDSLPRFAGWWGHNKERRFLMESDFIPIPTAEGWQMSNVPVLALASLKCALEIYSEAGMEQLRSKSILLTNYLEYLLHENCPDSIKIITPKNADLRGSQLSIVVKNKDRDFNSRLKEKGVITDWREPDVLRIAPVPLYNSFEDVWKFAEIMKGLLVV